MSAVDYLHSGAPVAPVRASWNPDASPSREDAAFNPARSLRESLERRRPRTATGVVGSTSRDENVNPNNPKPQPVGRQERRVARGGAQPTAPLQREVAGVVAG